MKTILPIFLISIILAFLATAATTTTIQKDKNLTVLITGTDTNTVSWTNTGFQATRIGQATFQFDSAVTTTVSVSIQRSGTDTPIGTTTATNVSTIAFGFMEELHVVYPNEVVVIDTGSAVNAQVSVTTETR